MKHTKKALFASALSLLLCISMLVGTTFAWFTDSVTTGVNVIKSGTLDIELEYSKDMTTWAPAAGVANIINPDARWEPGYTEVVYLRITNKGDLALKYQFMMNIVDTVIGKSVLGNDINLADYLKYDIVDATAAFENRAAALDAVEQENNLVGETVSGEMTTKDETKTLALIVYMPETVGNEANYRGVAPSIDLTFTLLATQHTYESDSFGNQYDKDATYPAVDVKKVGSDEKSLTAGDVTVVVPGQSVASTYTLEVTNKHEQTNDAGETTVSYDINLLKDGVKVQSVNGVTYKVQIAVGENKEIVGITHNGEAVTGYSYSSPEGKVSFETDSFSPFTVTYKSQAAKVGDTVYYTIDDAIANWNNNTTLTLLDDVTLSDVVTLKSTEYHVLNLSKYTMTAASKKDAIQIETCGRSNASYALDIKADATNPGGVTASGKAIVRTAGKSGVKDRPIIRFYAGVFNASYIVYHSGSNGTNCPQFQFHGGEFNGTIYTNRTLNQFYGGTFNGSLMMSVDSSAYALIRGGTFKQLSNLYMSALNSGKFTIGSAKGVYDREVYINDDGYYVVATATPYIEAAVVKAPGTNDYLKYSKVATEGVLKYTDVYEALKKNSSATIAVYVDSLDMTGNAYKGTMNITDTLTVTFAEGTTPAWKVASAVGGKTVDYTDSISNGVVTRVYTVG